MIPRTRLGMAWRFCSAGCCSSPGPPPPPRSPGFSRSRTWSSDIPVNPAIETKQIVLPPAGSPADDPHHRLRPPRRRAVRLRQHRHDAARATQRQSSTINVMSIPRDLQVDIPGYGIAKINAAYSEGGPGLLIKTIKQNVFPNLRINHIVDINFTRLLGSGRRDRLRLLRRRPPLLQRTGAGPDNYSASTSSPATRSCAATTRPSPVRCRSCAFATPDSDIVREARQQDFIRWAKDQFGVAGCSPTTTGCCGSLASTRRDKNLHSDDGLLNLFDLVLNSDAEHDPPGRLPGRPAAVHRDLCFVTSNARAEQAAFARFMAATPKAATAAANKAKATPGRAQGPQAPGQDPHRRPHRGPERRAQRRRRRSAVRGCPCTTPG